MPILFILKKNINYFYSIWAQVGLHSNLTRLEFKLDYTQTVIRALDLDSKLGEFELEFKSYKIESSSTRLGQNSTLDSVAGLHLIYSHMARNRDWDRDWN